MKGNFSSLDTAVMVALLRHQLLGTRVQNIYDVNAKTFLFKLARTGQKINLIVESGVRVHVSEYERELPPAPGGFASKLRKHIKLKRIDNIRQLGMDRVIILTFGGTGDQYNVIVELYNQGNIILTDAEFTMLALLRHRADDDEGVWAAKQMYPALDARVHEAVDADRAAAILDDPDGHDNLRTRLLYGTDYGRELVEHVLVSVGANNKTAAAAVAADAADGGELRSAVIAALLDAEALFNSLVSDPEAVKGYILTAAKQKKAIVVAKKKKKKKTRWEIDAGIGDDAAAAAAADGGGGGGGEADGLATTTTSTAADAESPPAGGDGTSKGAGDSGAGDGGAGVGGGGGGVGGGGDGKPNSGGGNKGKGERGSDDDDDGGGGDGDDGDDEEDEEEEEEEVKFVECTPYVFRQHEGKPMREFVSFATAVDEFFSRREAARAAEVLEVIEAKETSKVDDVRALHEQRLGGLQQAKAKSATKAALIEFNIEAVEEAILVIRSAIANSVDWQELENIIADEAAAGDAIAQLITRLNLADNEIIMSLGSPELETTLDVAINIGISAFANARAYYDVMRKHANKYEKTVSATDKVLKAAEEKARTQAKAKVKRPGMPVKRTRRALWFEKFHWFISSENYLIISGRDAQQNELVVKRHLAAGDAYVHADIHGAASCVIKNHRRDHPIPPLTLTQAGTMCVSHSKAWEAKIVTSAWWVHADQVSKTAPSGEYLSTGSFMIRGRKNFLPPTPLRMGYGILFYLDEDSLARHMGERRPRGGDDEDWTLDPSYSLETGIGGGRARGDGGDAGAGAGAGDGEGDDDGEDVEDGRSAKKELASAIPGAPVLTLPPSKGGGSSKKSDVDSEADDDNANDGGSNDDDDDGLEYGSAAENGFDEVAAAAAAAGGSGEDDEDGDGDGDGDGDEDFAWPETPVGVIVSPLAVSPGPGSASSSVSGRSSSARRKGGGSSKYAYVDTSTDAFAEAERKKNNGEVQTRKYMTAKERREAKKRRARGEDPDAPASRAGGSNKSDNNDGDGAAAGDDYDSGSEDSDGTSNYSEMSSQKGSTKAGGRKDKDKQQQSNVSSRTAKRKAAKAKKLREKYGDQDEADKELALALLEGGDIEAAAAAAAAADLTFGEVPGVPETRRVGFSRANSEFADGDSEADREAEEKLAVLAAVGLDNDVACYACGGTGHVMSDCPNASKTKAADLRRADRENLNAIQSEEQVLSEDALASLALIDRLTGKPHADDTLLYALPVCAPYDAITQYKYKVKLTPGNLKKGQAVKASMAAFTRLQGSTEFEVTLIRGIKDTEAIVPMLSGVLVGGGDAGKKGKGKGGKGNRGGKGGKGGSKRGGGGKGKGKGGGGGKKKGKGKR